jgi:uncharacterized protein YlxP (DUF503 family)
LDASLSPPPSLGAPVAVGVLRATLRVAGARSLKDRRQVSQALRDRLRARFDVAVCGLDDDGPPSVARLAVTAVSADAAQVERTLRLVREAIAGHAGASVVDVAYEVLRWPLLP